MNILVIRMHRFGDVLQLTPMLEGLKQKHPGCKITFLTGRDTVDLLSANPNIDQIVCIPEKQYRWYLKNRPERYAQIYNEIYDLIRELREKNFRLIVNRQYEIGGIVAGLIGAEEIRGGVFCPERGFIFEDEASKALFEIIRTNRKANRRNLVDWACHIAGMPPGCGDMAFYIQETDRWEADALLMAGGVREDESPVAVQMGAARSFRQWGAGNYGHVIKWLVNARDTKVVLLGSDDEKCLAEVIRRNLSKENSRVVDLIGKTTLKTLGGVLERCQYLITGDTGTMHMAASVGTPVIALFYGTAYPWETGPYGTGHLVLYADEPCAPCSNPEDCAFGHRCRKAITPEHVYGALEIAEAMKRYPCTPLSWPDDDVRLYMTFTQPGHDQLLVPIDKVNSEHRESGMLFSREPGRELDRGSILESAASALVQRGDNIIKKFYEGNKESFLETLPEYFDRLGRFVDFLKGRQSGDNNPETIQLLAPGLNEACRAMEAGDYVTIIDLIKYKFKAILESGTQEIKKTK
ncbi:MAG: glycosyltransferase family 9 protein [Thermodesulfobacteriota bacterium]|nr:glycosyltransferase family 9 protein [Thermodesulfobacteriota bacterium]